MRLMKSRIQRICQRKKIIPWIKEEKRNIEIIIEQIAQNYLIQDILIQVHLILLYAMDEFYLETKDLKIKTINSFKDPNNEYSSKNKLNFQDNSHNLPKYSHHKTVTSYYSNSS